jgi:hypothetical protein
MSCILLSASCVISHNPQIKATKTISNPTILQQHTTLMLRFTNSNGNIDSSQCILYYSLFQSMCYFPEGNCSYLTGNPVGNWWQCFHEFEGKPSEIGEKKQLNLHRIDSLDDDRTNCVPRTLCHRGSRTTLDRICHWHHNKPPTAKIVWLVKSQTLRERWKELTQRDHGDGAVWQRENTTEIKRCLPKQKEIKRC